MTSGGNITAAPARNVGGSILPSTLPELASHNGLFVAGVAALRPDDGLPSPFRSVALLAPDEPSFWPSFASSPEARDGRPHPLDRWSRRIVGRIACELRTEGVFPFEGPPWRPFTAWARRSGQAWPSPVGLLVHSKTGLWISFRGAILLEEEAHEVRLPRPCDDCSAPCLAACPVGALTAERYDVVRCHSFLDTSPDCLQGCRVRRVCPVGAGRRSAEQSEYHMKAFHPT